MANIALNIVVGGEENARRSIQQLTREYKTLNTTAKSLEEVFAGQLNSYDYLAAKGKNLASQLTNQEDKITDLKKALEYLTDVQKKYSSNTDALRQKLDAAQKAYDDAEVKTKDIAKALNDANKEYKENEAVVEYAKKQIENYRQQLVTAEGKVQTLNGELKTNEKRMQEAATSADGLAHSIDGYGNEVKDAADGTKSFANAADLLAQAIVASGAVEGAEKLKDAIMATAQASIEYESAFAGVRKTVDGTTEELAAISDGIKDMATEIPIATTELAGIAEAAGQLGIETGSILGFTEVMAQLGVTTNLSSEEAASSLAKFANITKMSASEYSNLGSSIVALGNNFATTESDIVSMATRLASTGEVVGLTEPQILAVATALSSVGIEAEAGGSAFSKLLKTIETDVETGSESVKEYARIAGMSAEEFADAWRKDAVSALSDFIDGLGRLEGSGTSAVTVLNDLGLTETRLSNAVLALASSEGLLSDALNLSNTAWAENTALAEEAAVRFETTESKIALLTNALNNLRITAGDQLKEAIGGPIEGLTELTISADEFVKEHPAVVSAITGIATGMGTLSVIATVTPLVLSLVKAFASITNPAGLAVTAIAALATGITAFILTLPEAHDELYYLSKEIDALRESTEKARESTLSLKDAHNEEITAISEESSKINNAIGVLEKYGGRADLTASETEILKGAIDTLNGSIPNLDLSFDDLNGTLEDTVLCLRAVAKVQELVSNAVANTELKESLESQTSGLEKTAEQANAKLEEASQKLAEYQKKRNDELEFWSNGRAINSGLETQWDDEIEEYEKKVKELQVIANNANGAVNANARAIAEAQAAINYADKQYEETIKSIKQSNSDLFSDVDKTTDEAADAFDEFMTTVENSGKKSASALADYGEAFKAGFSVPFLTAINETASNSDEVLGTMMARYRELVSTYGEGSEEVKAFVNDVNTTFTESAGAEDALVAGLMEYGIVVEETGKKSAASTKATKEAVDEAGQSIIDHAKLVQSNLNALTKEYDSAYKSARSSLDGIGGAFESLTFTSDKSVGEMQSNLRTQADYFTGTLNNINNAVRVGFNEELVLSLAEGGKQTQSYLQTIMNEFTQLAIEYGENSEEARSFVDSFNEDFERTSLAKDALANTMAGMQTNFEERKSDILSQSSDLVTELEGYTGNAYDEVSAAVTNVVGNVADTLGKIELAIAESSVKAGTAMQTMRDTLDAKLEGTDEKGREAGENYTAGLVKGILDGTPAVSKAVLKLVDEAIIEAVNKGLEIHSPSRVGMEQGEFYDEGIAQGIERNTGTVTSASLKMISNLESSSQSAAAAAGKSLGNTMAAAMAEALSAGQALRKAAESGELTVDGKTVQTAASVGIPSLTGQAAADWNAEQKRDFGLPDDWTNQDIVDWLNAGGAQSGGYSLSTQEKIESAVTSQSNGQVTVSKLGNQGADGKTWGYGTVTKYEPDLSKRSAGSSQITINQTFTGTTSEYEAKQGAKAGVQEALYY